MSTTTSRKVLKSLPLTRQAASGLKDAVRNDDPEVFRDVFVKALNKPLKRIQKRFGKQPLFSAWSEPFLELSGRERELAVALDELSAVRQRPGKKKSLRKRIESLQAALDNWLSDAGGPLGAWESITVPELLLRYPGQFSAESFVAALSVLSDALQNDPTDGLFRDQRPADNTPAAILETMIRDFEFPGIASLLLSPLGDHGSARAASSTALAKILLESSDRDGLLHGSLISHLPHWLAPFTRSAVWAKMFREPLGNAELTDRLRNVAERSVLLARPVTVPREGQTPESAESDLADVLQILLEVVDSALKRPLQKLLRRSSRPVSRVSRPARPKRARNEAAATADSESTAEQTSTPEHPPGAAIAPPSIAQLPSAQSDKCGLAILRSSLKADADVVTLNWTTNELQVFLSAAGVPILDGHWGWSVRLNDELLSEPSGWKCSCWFTDPEAVFVELEGEVSATVRRVRQILLVACERMAFLTDSVTSADPGSRVQLTASLPLTREAAVAADDVTRELQINTPSRTVRAFPLWLEDDRIHHAIGSFREHDGQLELSASGQGGVTMPLALDWHPKRTNAPADWARLTVTEARRVVSPSEASGHRIRIGNHQVLIYRSLRLPATSRSVLGLHTWDESVYTRIRTKGVTMSPLVEVEAPERADK